MKVEITAPVMVEGIARTIGEIVETTPKDARYLAGIRCAVVVPDDSLTIDEILADEGEQVGDVRLRKRGRKP